MIRDGFRKYREYLKDNPERYWFRRKLYGWGWTPARWQGWLTLLLFIFGVFWIAGGTVENQSPTKEDIFMFLGKMALLVGVLLAICFKTGEKPRWQWGIPEKKEEGKDE